MIFTKLNMYYSILLVSKTTFINDTIHVGEFVYSEFIAMVILSYYISYCSWIILLYASTYSITGKTF